MRIADMRSPTESSPPTAAPPNVPTSDDAKKIAAEFEATFIAEMLSHAGFERALASDAGFGGEAMSGMLIQKYAEMISERGGLGVAAMVEAQILRRATDAE
jgi:Rod binding domain-containing protein